MKAEQSSRVRVIFAGNSVGMLIITSAVELHTCLSPMSMIQEWVTVESLQVSCARVLAYRWLLLIQNGHVGCGLRLL